ncbi:importin subunit beta-1-like isoform X1 [Pimephales promelas]|uniref:importin subunit beta-1-like isoform X1 n=1 Tax=Pimephales promelas TaxID=90988 RepID=UPI0019556B7E|nr:importin subunit beta-1-like isoform X1 [Pimephales promelas]
MELITILEKTVSPDRNELEAAQKFLEQAAIENLPTFLVELSKVLANPGNTQVARVAAGLQVKNSLTSKDPDVKTQNQQRWLAIDSSARREIKNYVSPHPSCETRTPGHTQKKPILCETRTHASPHPSCETWTHTHGQQDTLLFNLKLSKSQNLVHLSGFKCYTFNCHIPRTRPSLQS